MGKNDSYAFLEVFFGDKTSSNNLHGVGAGTSSRGMKREREEDNEIGLSLDDESPSATNALATTTSNEGTSFLNSSGSDTLKRAYDDAMAAQGLLHISRSSEKLTDLALPTKMQKTLSQDFSRQKHDQDVGQNRNMEQQKSEGKQFPLSSTATATLVKPSQDSESQQYPAQPTAQSGATSTAVQVHPETRCALCGLPGVDTQLRPCGHMFHEKCLKPLLEGNMPPKCPIDGTLIESALLAIPMESSGPIQSQKNWSLVPSASSPAATYNVPTPQTIKSVDK